jgi:hypothetical protein
VCEKKECKTDREGEREERNREDTKETLFCFIVRLAMSPGMKIYSHSEQPILKQTSMTHTQPTVITDTQP